jgi:multidrug efflux pump subunit AcrB
VARYLFVPMAEAVVFAMLASYLLSRTVVPTMAKYLLKEHDDAEMAQEAAQPQSVHPVSTRLRAGFEKCAWATCACSRCASITRRLSDSVHVFAVARWLCCAAAGPGLLSLVDAGQFKIHVRARTGTRIEETALLCDHIDGTIREQIPAKEVVTIVDNIGLPYSGLNLSYSTSAPIGPADADIQVQLTEPDHPPPASLRREAAHRAESREYPGVTFYVLPVDIVTQILNFGLSAPIDIQIVGPDLYGNRALAEKMLNEVRYVPGAADARIQQPFDYPNMTVNVDRTRAQDIGLTQANVAQSLLVALSGSFQTTPNFYLDPKSGVTYNVAIQAPQYRLDSLAALKSLPVTGSGRQRSRPAGGAGNQRAQPPVPGSSAPVQCWATWRPSCPARAGHGEPLQRAAGARYLRQRGRHRPGHVTRRWRRSSRKTRRSAARLALHPARAERDHESPTSACWAGWRSPSCWSTC